MSQALQPSKSLPGGNGRSLEPVRGERAAAWSDETAPLDLREILGILRRHLRLIAAVVFVCTAGAVATMVLSQPSYRMGAVIRLTDPRSALSGGLADPTAPVLGRTVDPLLSEVQTLTSYAVLGQVVDSMSMLRVGVEDFPAELLTDLAIGSEVARDSLHLLFGPTSVSVERGSARGAAAYGRPVVLAGIRFTIVRAPPAAHGLLVIHPRDAAIASLRAHLKVEPRENTDVVDVSYVSHDLSTLQPVLNRVVETLRGASASSSKEESHRRRVFLEQQLRLNDSVLAAARTKLSAFRSRQAAYSAREKFSTEQAGLAGLEVRREELDAQRRISRELLARVTASKGAAEDDALRALISSPDLGANPVIVGLYGQLSRYEEVHDSLTTGAFGRSATNPDVQRVETLIATTRQRLARAVQSAITSLDARVAALDGLRAQNVNAFQSLSSAEQEEAVLAEQVETARKLADELHDEYQKAQLAEAVEAGQVQIVDYAVGQGQRVGVGPVRKIAFGVLFGLVLGSGLALLFEHLNTAIRRQTELETTLGLSGVVIIPRAVPKGRVRRRSLTRHRSTAARLPSRPAVHASLVTLTAPGSSSAEAFRGLRTKLVFSEPLGALRVIAVSSPEPRDGKTTVASNLAVAFAQQGQRVVLVDCDLRRPNVHQIFGLPQAPGLTTVLAGECTPEQAVHVSPIPNLHILTAGRSPGNPTELLGEDAMKALISQLRDAYDMVIVDTPPLLACVDAAVVATIVDGTVLVVRAGQTTREGAQAALQQFTDVGVTVVSAVLNDPDAKVPEYSGGYYYQYGYGAAASR